jgi:hypothetical protein
LPEDFTPELIAQLASEGYDLTSSSGGRKARARIQPQQQATQPPSQMTKKERKRNLENLSSSSSSSESENDDGQDNNYEASINQAKKKFGQHEKTSSSGKLNCPNKLLYVFKL